MLIDHECTRIYETKCHWMKSCFKLLVPIPSFFFHKMLVSICEEITYISIIYFGIFVKLYDVICYFFLNIIYSWYIKSIHCNIFPYAQITKTRIFKNYKGKLFKVGETSPVAKSNFKFIFRFCHALLCNFSFPLPILLHKANITNHLIEILK